MDVTSYLIVCGLKLAENEIVQMFRLPNSREERLSFPMEGGWDSRNGHNARTLDERFIRILKIFKWGPDAEKSIGSAEDESRCSPGS